MRRELVELVQYSFGSVWALELLLLLYRQQNRTWYRHELVGELRSSELVVNESIARLVASGLIVIGEHGTLAFSPTSDSVSTLVPELDEEYQKRPAAIRRLIVQGPTGKLKSFSDAFRLDWD